MNDVIKYAYNIGYRLFDTAQMYHNEDAYKVKTIGVCNFEKEQLQHLLSHCTITPMINQIEHTPLMHDEDLLSFCKENNIIIMAWGPLLGGNMENQKI